MRYDEDPNRTLGARLREADPVPPPPREAMWSSIEFARRFGPHKPARRAWPASAEPSTGAREATPFATLPIVEERHPVRAEQETPSPLMGNGRGG